MKIRKSLAIQSELLNFITSTLNDIFQCMQFDKQKFRNILKKGGYTIVQPSLYYRLIYFEII